MWVANPRSRNAFKVLRRLKTKPPRVQLVNLYGLKFTKTVEELEAAGYHFVKQRPVYAGECDKLTRRA